MKQKKWVVPISIFMLLVAVTFFLLSFSMVSGMEKHIEGIEASQKATNAFFEADNKPAYYNRDALLLIEESQKAKEEDAFYTYRAPEGFLLKSYSNAWNSEKLEALYQELKQNKHGKELESLYEVVVRAEDDERAEATHQTGTQKLEFAPQFPALPKSLGVSYTLTMGTITLYGGDIKTTVNTMAHALSHEYGHHYTFYYMLTGWEYGETDYGKLRNLGGDKVRSSAMRPSEEDYWENHHWYLAEIAAEDYVQLMGSPNSRHVALYKDVNQAVQGSPAPNEADWQRSMNRSPQENLMIPLAAEVSGLEAYFYQFIGETPPNRPETIPFSIRIQRGSKSYPNLQGGGRTFVHYQLTWDKVYGDQGVVYTLVCYEEDAYGSTLYPIKTVRAGESASAYIGTMSRERGNSVEWTWDNLDKGNKVFRVTVLLPDGTVKVSDPLPYAF